MEYEVSTAVKTGSEVLWAVVDTDIDYLSGF
jgi:hypothetical protein